MEKWKQRKKIAAIESGGCDSFVLLMCSLSLVVMCASFNFAPVKEEAGEKKELEKESVSGGNLHKCKNVQH